MRLHWLTLNAELFLKLFYLHLYALIAQILYHQNKIIIEKSIIYYSRSVLKNYLLIMISKTHFNDGTTSILNSILV